MSHPITIISFGYLHGQPPAAAVVKDVRPYRDPHVDPAMRQLTGRDQAVIAKVLATPRIAGVINFFAADAAEASRGSSAPTLAVGCAGGRHRSVVVADTAAGLLRELGYTVTVVHRDINQPVVNR